MASLLNLLWEEGRHEEADEIIYSRPVEEPTQDSVTAAELGQPGVSDVLPDDHNID